MSDLKLYILGYPQEFRGNHWKRAVEQAASQLGWEVIHRGAREAETEEVLRECKDADLFLWLRTHGNNPKDDAGVMLRRIEDAGVPTVGMHMDLYWTLETREAYIDPIWNPWWSCQRVYTADGGHQAEFAARGINHFWMPPGMSDDFFGLHAPLKRGRYKKPYVFVGSNSRGIHGSHRTELIRWAGRKYHGEFHRYGAHNKVYGEDLNQIYSVARVAIGDSAPAERYWSDRIPTTMGRGGILAHPRTSGMEEQGYNDSNMILFDRFEFEDLGERIDAMTEQDRAYMREAALTVTFERHMWRHRLLQIKEEVLG